MSALFDRMRNAGAIAYVRVVQAMNAFAATAGIVIGAVYEMYPSAVQEYANSLSPKAKIAALVLWAVAVHLSLRQAAKKADGQ